MLVLEVPSERANGRARCIPAVGIHKHTFNTMAEGQHVQASTMDQAMDWVLKNKLKAIGYTWLTGVAGSLVSVVAMIRIPTGLQGRPQPLKLNLHLVAAPLQAYQWTRPIPTQLKIMHSRVYAQAITLASLGAIAGIELYSQSRSKQ